MKYFSLTDIGKKRINNEDSFFSYISEGKNSYAIFIIADGMGGYENGDYASRETINIVNGIVKREFENLTLSRCTVEDIKHILSEAIKTANDEIYNYSKEKDILMGTTFVLSLIVDEKLFVANIGDSRTYMMSRKNLVQVTKDNSFVWQLLEKGIINEEEARTHKDRNKITKAVGFEKNIEADFYIREIEKGDKLLICSDGLTSMVKDEFIKEVMLKNDDPEEIAKNLLNKAMESGGHDNITITTVVI